jgi:hypothetical protein
MMRRARLDQNDEGVTIVEAAFVLPVVIVMFFAIIEFGLLFAGISTTSSSTRAGARYASANFGVSSDRQVAANAIRDEVQAALSARTGLDTPQILWIYHATATGTPVGGSFASCATECFRYTWDAATQAFVVQGGGWANPDVCIDVVNPGLDSIGVYLQVKHDLVSGFFMPNRIIQEHTVTRLEPIPPDQCGG